MAEAPARSRRARRRTRSRRTDLVRATGVRAGLARGAPVAAAIVAGILLAAVPVDATTHWTVTPGPSSPSEAKATTKPAAPTSISASCVSSSKKKVTVTWSAVANASSYTVFDTDASTTTPVATVATTSWTSGTLATGTYKYKVSANFGANWAGTKSTATSKVTINSSTPKCKT